MPNQKPSDKVKTFDNYGSKLKNVLIELKNYTFFHRPTGIEDEDKRFIGREKVREKLKAIITNSEVKSGAYLITGFRGMGKTSVVNKVLAGLKNSNLSPIDLYRVSRIFILLLLLTFLDVQSLFYDIKEAGALFPEETRTLTFKSVILLLLPLTLFVVCCRHLMISLKSEFKKDKKSGNFLVRNIKNTPKSLNRLFSSLTEDVQKIPKNSTLVLSQDYIIISLIHFLSLYFLVSFYETPDLSIDYITKFSIYLFSTLLVILFRRIYSFKNPQALRKTWLIKGLTNFSKFILHEKNYLPFRKGILKLVNRGRLKFILLVIGITIASSIYSYLFTVIKNEQTSFYLLRIITLIFFLYLDRIFNQVRNFINYSHITVIKINLGQEKLQEKDILRIITKSIYEKYKRITNPFSSLRRFAWVFFSFMVFYIFILIFYYYKPTYSLINEMRENSGLVYYFPSQRVFCNDNGLVSYGIDRSVFNTIETFERVNNKKGEHPSFKIEDYANIIYRYDESFYQREKEIKEKIFNDLKNNNDSLTGQKLKNRNQEIADTALMKFYRDNLLVENDSILNFTRDTSYIINKDTIPYSQLAGFHQLDYFIYDIYTGLVHFLFENQIFNNSPEDKNLEQSLLNGFLDLHPNFHLAPPRLDYLFIIYFIFMFIIYRLISRVQIFGMHHRRVLRELSYLVDGIDATITQESKRSASWRGLNWTLGRRKTSPVAGPREIETRLIQILALSEKIPMFRMRPKFVFVFDELDKIEPTGTYASSEKDRDVLEYVTEGSKKRQETIGRILSNLKHFFNTARAKFIFIAGREMYDAALADISDRDSLIGSLFHDIIYVDSFYKDPRDNKLGDITSMTERYVCKFLLPPSTLEQDLSLKKYRRYLQNNYDYLTYEELTKIIITLLNFITYLSYRSNGSPKKITKIFEEYIRPLSEERRTEAERPSNVIFVGENKNSLYLEFGFYNQYIFGFSSYLFNPFLLSVSKYLRDFGDKLLVSTAFLLNHVYKFHNSGFSYRTLELTPEIIAINKAPELRDFIERLLRFLERTHIREIITGMHQFKFNSKIEKEISFISKISEKESAAYNFTLDESLEIKKIYRHRLRLVRKVYEGELELNNHIDSLAYLNLILGDLHFHDQEYDDAVAYYKEATLKLRNTESNEFKLDTIVFYIRNELKLGMTFEKKKNYDDALMVYENLKLRIKKFTEGENELFKETRILPALRLIYQPLIAELQLIEKHSIKSITKHYVRENLVIFQAIVNKLRPEQNFLIKAEYYDKMGDILYYKNGLNFGMKVENDKTYKAFINLKKENLEIQKKEIEDAVSSQITKKSLYSLSLPVSAYEYYMRSLNILITIGIDEFYIKKDRDIKLFNIEKPVESEKVIIHKATELLLKNTDKKFPITKKSIYESFGNSLSDAGDCILSFIVKEEDREIDTARLSEILDLRLSEGKEWEENSRPSKPGTPKISMKKTSNDAFKKEIRNEIAEYWKTISEENTSSLKKEEEKIIKDISKETIGKINDEAEKYYKFIEKCYENYSRLEIAIRYIYIAAQYFLKAGDHKEYAFQLTKITHIITLYLKEEGKANKILDKEKFCKVVGRALLEKAIRNTFRAYESNNDAEINKIKHIFSIDQTNEKDNKRLIKLISTSSSASDDIKEILILYKEIELILKPSSELKLTKGFVNPYMLITQKYNRILELRYKTRFNYLILDKVLKELGYKGKVYLVKKVLMR